MRLLGSPLELDEYRAESLTNERFRGQDLGPLDRFFLPPSMAPLADEAPLARRTFLEDDNRGAVSSDPVAVLDGVPFYLSVKGVGSTVDPFSLRPLDQAYAAALSSDPEVRRRLTTREGEPLERIITGELWLRGSPYGGQGLAHGLTALRLSERADLTSIGGFLVAPVVKLAYLPASLEERIRTIHWYRRYRGRIVQELRLLPSNVRIYFHARNTVGTSVRHVFDLFSIDSAEKSLAFETRFVRSAVAMLTLFARSLTFDAARGRYVGLDFHDVWLDKDAVLAPNGSVYFVDLEGIEEVAVEKATVREKVEDQVYRSLYEFMFAYEQIDQERRRRFGEGGDRKGHFETIVTEALRDDPCVRVHRGASGLELEIRNRLSEESLNTNFPLVDR